MISIVIEDSNEVRLTTTNGIAETEIAAAIVVKAMKNLHQETNAKSKLVLVAYNPDKKLHAVKEIKETLNLGLKESKDFIDECIEGKMVTLSRGTRSEMSKLKDKFDPSVVQIRVIDDKEWL